MCRIHAWSLRSSGTPTPDRIVGGGKVTRKRHSQQIGRRHEDFQGSRSVGSYGHDSLPARARKLARLEGREVIYCVHGARARAGGLDGRDLAVIPREIGWKSALTACEYTRGGAARMPKRKAFPSVRDVLRYTWPSREFRRIDRT